MGGYLILGMIVLLIYYVYHLNSQEKRIRKEVWYFENKDRFDTNSKKIVGYGIYTIKGYDISSLECLKSLKDFEINKFVEDNILDIVNNNSTIHKYQNHFVYPRQMNDKLFLYVKKMYSLDDDLGVRYKRR